MLIESHVPGDTDRGKRLALVIGVDLVPRSLRSSLRSACKDAREIAQTLTEHCDFMLLQPPLLDTQATSAVVKQSILNLARRRNVNDLLLFYFSGHGIPMNVEADRDEVYLGTHDFSEEEVEEDETLHLSLSWLRDKLYWQTEAGKVVLILDCCYSGQIGSTNRDPYLQELQRRIAYYFHASGPQHDTSYKGLRQALTATGHTSIAQEGPQHGLMTDLLLPVLRGEVTEPLGKQGQLTLTRLFVYLQEQYEKMGLPQISLSGDAAGYCILASFQSHDTSRSSPLPAHTQLDRPANYLPFPRNPFFQPRPGEFEQLERLLFTPAVQQSVHLGLVGVTGMGGVGKTQLAVELAYRYQQRFPGGIFWMSATGQSIFDWQSSLANLAVKTGYLPPGDDPANPEHVALRARHLCRYFASHADVLVILDNVEEPRLVTTALSDLAGGALSCKVLYTSRRRTPLAGVTLYSVVPLSEAGALRLLLETTRPALLAEILEGQASIEAEAARTLCREVGYLPLALTHLQGLLEDKQLRLQDLAVALRKRGAMVLGQPQDQQTSLMETFQLSWQQVREERARQFFLLISLFPEATPIPLWLAGLATGLGESARQFEPLWEVFLSLQELNLVERLTDEQVRLHPLVRAFGQYLLQQEGKQGRVLRAEAGQRLVTAFRDLALLEQRARRVGYWGCLEQVRAARDYALLLYLWPADRLNRLEYLLDRESHLLADERWWPRQIPGLFYQQLFNRAVETGESLAGQDVPPPRWIKQIDPVGAEDPALLRIFAGHTGSVNCVTFSPDGRLVLTGSDDNTARLWETSSRRILVILDCTGKVSSVAFSPDGRLVLTGSDDTTARLWETSSGRPLATLQCHTNWEAGYFFSREGRTFVSDDADKMGISVAFSSDGQQIFTGSRDGMVRVWETNIGRTSSTWEDSAWLVESMASSLDESLALTNLLNVTVNGTGMSMVFSPDGRLVLAGSAVRDYPTARIWETSSGRTLVTLEDHTGWVSSVAFSPDGKLVLTGSYDGTARLWEMSRGRALATSEGLTDRVEGILFSPDGRLVLMSSPDNMAQLWETSSGRLLATLQGHTGKVSRMAFSPDGRLILTGSDDNTARLWETSSGRPLAILQGHTDSVNCVAFSPDGRLVITGGSFRDQTVRLWETSSGRPLAVLQGHTWAIESVAFSPDERLILSGANDGTARLWETSSGKLLAILGHTEYNVVGTIFSPDGRLILTGSIDNKVRLWKTSSGELLATLQGQNGPSRMAFSPDGRLILTVLSDHAVQLWETSSGRPLATLQGHTGEVIRAAFSPNGQMVVTCDENGWVLFWRMQHLLGLYIACSVPVVYWQNATHLVLVATKGAHNYPYIHRLSLEGPGWE